LRILYVASDQVVPGTTGGSVHVLEVARGLAERGHEVHVVVHRDRGVPDREQLAGAHFHRIDWFPDHRLFRLRARAKVEALARALAPHVVMERYYNFGGEGVLAAERLRLPSLLEVNSPAVDHPGSLKAALDAALLVRPLKRHRERVVAAAHGLIAPLPAIVPEFARSKTETVTWGANVARFRPELRSEHVRAEMGVPKGAVAVVFSGSFRPWHGVPVFEDAARLLASRSDIFFVLVGGDRPADAAGYRGRRLGRQPYERMPELVAACDIGVAPYDTARLRQLQLGFYWSPLKLFEYMASGLPSVTVPRFPLTEIVREGQEGLHFPEADPDALAQALVRLVEDGALRARLGQSARARVVERYSWQKHCEQVEAVLARLAA
jgi:glycosyltransferase involved in cell wall biosynthesis